MNPFYASAALGAVALSLALFSANPSGSGQDSRAEHAFNTGVQVKVTEETLIVKSDGIPDHPTAQFPNDRNPNSIRKQDYTFYIPRKPHRAEKPTRLPMGPIGVAINGIPLYNPFNAEGLDAVTGLYAEVFDTCCGHPDQMGRYHYHKYPVCLKTPFHDAEGKHSALIGYAFDGYAIYGPNGENGKPPTDLDGCNGHEDKQHGYHYHVSNTFPYILGGYRGEVDKRNFDRPGMHGMQPNNGRFPMRPNEGTPPPPPNEKR
jgi:hypothetical protein